MVDAQKVQNHPKTQFELKFSPLGPKFSHAWRVAPCCRSAAPFRKIHTKYVLNGYVTAVSVALSGGARTVFIPKSGKMKARFL